MTHKRLNALKNKRYDRAVADFRDAVKNRFKESAWKPVEDAYRRQYAPLYAELADDPDAMELAIWEEMLCSAYAGINEYGVRVSVYQAQAVEVLDKAEESAKGPEWISLPKPESVTAKKQNAAEPEGLSPPETQKKFLAAGYNDSDDESFILDNGDDIIQEAPSYYSNKYWTPRWSNKERTLAYETAEAQILSKQNFVDGITKYLFASKNGTTVFAMRTGDGSKPLKK